MKIKIYLDNAATTQVDQQVLRVMLPYLKKRYGNPSSIYTLGREARQGIEKAREKVACFLKAKPQEIVFTSSASESNNLALRGVAEALINQGKHIIISAIEHHSVLEVAKHLEKQGFEVTYLGVDKYGSLNPEEIAKAIKKETILVSIMYANNEIGTIQPIREITKKIKDQRSKTKPIFHTDAVQAIQYLDCNVTQLGVDLLSLTGHKFHAPKGVGALYIRQGTPIIRQQDGGNQENKRRAGTENVASIVGLGEAIELIQKDQKNLLRKVRKLRDYFIKRILKEIPETILTGHSEKRLPHIASFCFKYIEGEAILLKLDGAGIAASSGSACTSLNLEPSHVLSACGISPDLAHGSLRFSLSKNTTKKELDYTVKAMKKIARDLRAMSPMVR